VQYFPDFKLLLSNLKSFLKPQGEIHIIDSPFYKQNEIADAKQRTITYYTDLGFPEMASNYFHHLKSAIQDFEVLYKPKNRFFSKILSRKESPFYWLRLR